MIYQLQNVVNAHLISISPCFGKEKASVIESHMRAQNGIDGE